MATLIEDLPQQIADLEASHGSDNPYVQDLKRQLAAMKANVGKTGQEVYRMQAVQFAPAPKTQSEDDEPKAEQLAGQKMVVGRAVQNFQIAMRAQGKPVGAISPKEILAMADRGEVEDLPAVQAIRKLLENQNPSQEPQPKTV